MKRKFKVGDKVVNYEFPDMVGVVTHYDEDRCWVKYDKKYCDYYDWWSYEDELNKLEEE